MSTSTRDHRGAGNPLQNGEPYKRSEGGSIVYIDHSVRWKQRAARVRRYQVQINFMHW